MSDATDPAAGLPGYLEADRLVLAIESHLSSVAAATAAARDYLTARGASAASLHDVELVLEELSVNVIRHASADRPRPAMTLELGLAADAILLTLEDDGAPFNPLEVPEPVRPASIEEARVGGLGIMLVRRNVRSMQYEQRNGRNRVSVAISRRGAWSKAVGAGK